MTTYKRIGAVKTTLNILRFLADQKTPASGNDVAAALGMPHGTCMCYLATLDDDGVVRQTGDCFELGMGMAVFWAKTRAREERRLDEAKQNLKSIGVI